MPSRSGAWIRRAAVTAGGVPGGPSTAGSTGGSGAGGSGSGSGAGSGSRAVRGGGCGGDSGVGAGSCAHAADSETNATSAKQSDGNGRTGEDNGRVLPDYPALSTTAGPRFVDGGLSKSFVKR